MPTLTVFSDTPVATTFRYFWIKEVRGFDAGQHCARCLLGSYVRAVGVGITVREPIEFGGEPGVIFYLCGVSRPYRWHNNLHLALRVRDGAEARASLYQGGEVVVFGCERIDFDPSIANAKYGDRGLAYLTCRNFQFGAHHFNCE